jgi:sirohydrochlorin cobaltochelatase
VSHEAFSDGTLVLVGHGSTMNAESSAPVYQHAAELRRRGLFAGVCEAFWKQEPDVRQVLAGLSTPRVFIVPLFISEGYFSTRVIPRALGFDDRLTLRTQHSTVYYCKPVGTHESMAGVLLARARGVVRQFPFPRAPESRDTTLFIAGHGTEENENSRKAIDRQVERIRVVDEYAAVHGVFMEEEPRIDRCYELAQTKNVVVVPFFISDGMHAREDIPVLLGETQRTVAQRLAEGRPPWRNPTERQGKRVWYASAVGTEPHIADVIVERVREAAEGIK